jgi:hypothetical protein
MSNSNSILKHHRLFVRKIVTIVNFFNVNWRGLGCSVFYRSVLVSSGLVLSDLGVPGTQLNRRTDRPIDRQVDKLLERYTNTQMDSPIGTQTGCWTVLKANRWIDGHTHKQMDRLTDWQIRKTSWQYDQWDQMILTNLPIYLKSCQNSCQAEWNAKSFTLRHFWNFKISITNHVLKLLI